MYKTGIIRVSLSAPKEKLYTYILGNWQRTTLQDILSFQYSCIDLPIHLYPLMLTHLFVWGAKKIHQGQQQPAKAEKTAAPSFKKIWAAGAFQKEASTGDLGSSDRVTGCLCFPIFVPLVFPLSRGVFCDFLISVLVKVTVWVLIVIWDTYMCFQYCRWIIYIQNSFFRNSITFQSGQFIMNP